MKNFKKFSAIFILTSLFVSTSCVETVIVGSTATGALATREKTLSSTKDDVVISAKIAKEFLTNGLNNPGNSIDAMVNEGRVLLVGIARDANKAKLASELVWKISNVKEVIDEIQIRDGDSFHLKDFSSAASDYLITTKLETKLFFARNVACANYKISTVNKTIYLLGVAPDNDELQKVLSIASKVRGTEKVVNHVILADDARRRK